MAEQEEKSEKLSQVRLTNLLPPSLCDVMPFDVMPFDVMSCDVMSCDVMSCDVM